MNTQYNRINLDNNYKLNTFGITGVEFFWGIGLPLLIESAFLQIFLRSLGASSVTIGIIPAIFYAGQAVCGILSAYFTSSMTNKRTAVIIVHCIPSLFLFLYGLILRIYGFDSMSIPVFLLFYALFSFSIGLILPVWQNYLVSIFSPGKIVPALSIMMLAQTSGKLLGSYLLSRVVSGLSINSDSGSLVFLICSVLFLGSSFFFLMTKEFPAGENSAAKAKVPFYIFFKSTLRDIFRNRNFMMYLGSELEFFSVITLLSFYAVYAIEYGGLTPGMAAGGLMASNIIGQLMVNIFLGIRNKCNLKQKAWLSRISTISGIMILILNPHFVLFFFAGFLLGFSRAIRPLIYSPTVKKLSGKNDATGYFAIAPMLTVPISSGISLLSGRFLDMTSFLGENSFRILFSILGLIVLISLVFLKKTDFGESKTQSS